MAKRLKGIRKSSFPVALLHFPCLVYADEITLAWDQPTSNEDRSFLTDLGRAGKI